MRVAWKITVLKLENFDADLHLGVDCRRNSRYKLITETMISQATHAH